MGRLVVNVCVLLPLIANYPCTIAFLRGNSMWAGVQTLPTKGLGLRLGSYMEVSYCILIRHWLQGLWLHAAAYGLLQSTCYPRVLLYIYMSTTLLTTLFQDVGLHPQSLLLELTFCVSVQCGSYTMSYIPLPNLLCGHSLASFWGRSHLQSSQ